MTDVKERELNMANALRRGPGWWMDPDGNWNPPEAWPESTPPLPDWVRDENGRWHAPDVPAPAALEAVPDLEEPEPAPTVDPAPTSASPVQPVRTPPAAPGLPPRSAASLGYAAYTKFDPEEIEPEGVSLKRALFAAVGFGATAGMIAAGITVLLGVF